MTDARRTDQTDQTDQTDPVTPTAPTSPEFIAPGPGTWQRDTDHQAATRSPLLAALFTEAFTEGSRVGFARYGLPLDRLQGADLHGWFFFRAVPAGVPDRGTAPPPLPVLRVLTRLAPELRRRERTARTTLAERRWLADARAWAAERPDWTARISALLAAELDTVDDAVLRSRAAHAIDLADALLHRHFELLGMAIGVGRLLAVAPELGLRPDEVIEVLRGSAPETSASAVPLAELASIAGARVPDTAAGLRALSPRAAELVDEYVRVYGWRPLGNDPECVSLAEHPDQIVELVRAASTRRHSSVDVLPTVRERVPAAHRARFDALLAEARECYGAADDNAAVLGWAIGALRRVALEVGRRGADRGDLDDATDVFLLSPDEFVTIAGGARAVMPDELRTRRARRRAADLAHVPDVVGGTPVAPPPASVFPPAMAELTEAVGIYLSMKFSATGAPARVTAALTVDDGGTARVACRGTGVVAGRTGGRIVVSASPDDALLRVEPGDILVCPYTSAAWNSLFPVLGGVVTQFGGPLGHTGVMAREFGIPCMTGIGELPLDADGHTGTLDVHVGRTDG